jgi:hypothetical protein
MKYGNVSHTLVQLPELFKNRIKKNKIDIFSLPKKHSYFRYSDFINKSRDYNWNNNFRTSHFKSIDLPCFDYSFLPITSRNKSQEFNNSKDIDQKISPSNTKESFSFELQKTVDNLLEKIKLDKDNYLLTARKSSLDNLKKSNTSKEGFLNKIKEKKFIDKNKIFQDLLNKKVLSLKSIPKYVKDQFSYLLPAAETKRNYDKVNNSIVSFRKTIHNYINTYRIINESRNKVCNEIKEINTKKRSKSV